MQIIDLFSGIGGFSLAGSWMGWRTIQFCEIDPWCHKVLKKHWPNVPIHTDINTLTPEIIKQSPLYDANEQTIVTGGVPCQPASTAGKRRGGSDERWLWPQTIKFIGEFKPTLAVLENVAGLVSMENGKTLDRILSDLEDEGYTTEQVIIPACAVGAWHRRDRIWIVAHSNSSRYVHGKFTEQSTKRGVDAQRQPQSSDKYGKIIPHTRLLGSEVYKQQAAGVVECGEDTAHCNNQRLQRRAEAGDLGGGGKKRNKQSQRCDKLSGGENGATQSPVGRMVNGLPPFMDGYWDREPDEVPRVATGVKDRVNRLRGLGNAIVPQVAYQIFKAIEQYELSLSGLNK